MTDWTDAQKDAIAQRNKNLLISAGAGSGKTAVLTERIIRLITEDKTDAGRFLVLTFTKAAASEMKQRIRKELYKKIRSGQDKEFLFAQLNRLENAQISTIHSFCLNIIKRYYYVIGIDPASALLGEAESKLLKQEALENLFEAEYSEQDDSFIELADMYSPGNNDERFKEIILYFYNFIMNRPDPWGWLEDACGRFAFKDEDFHEHPAVVFLTKHAAQYLDEALTNINAAENLCVLYDAEGKRTQYIVQMKNCILSLKDNLENGFEKFIDSVNAVSFARYDMRKPCEKSGEIKKYKENAKNAVETLQKLFGFSYNTYLEQLKELYPHMNKLAEIVNNFGGIYSRLKKEKMSMDYNDLEHYCLAVFGDEQAAREIKAQYDYVFVDEYQDTNSIQEEIITKAVNENALFAVGDIKQSIYRFREAEPDIFMRRYCQYKNGGRDNEQLIFLNANFRASSVIIGGINEIFSKIMFSSTGGVDYAPDETLTAGRQMPVMYKPEIHIIENGAQESEAAEESDLAEDLLDFKNREAEAAYAAQLIKQLLNEEIADEKTGLTRKIRPGDIAVIGRSMRAAANTYIEAMRQAGISAESEKSGSYYDEMEVALIMDLLKVIDNAKNDLPLLGVMRSFLYTFNADEMLKIRLFSKNSLYYHEAIANYAQNGDDEALKNKVNGMLYSIISFRETSKHTSIENLLRKIYSATRISAFMGALPNGRQRQENLKYLLKLASHYETTSFKGLYNFIGYVEKSKVHDSSFRVNIQTESEDTVKLMTVHKSKGLEFNVVIVTGCAAPFNLADTREDIILDKTLGICPVYYDMRQSFYCDSLPKTAAKLLISQETAAEEMRILYVAATRAKQRLIFTGAVRSGKAERFFSDAAAPLTQLNIRQTNSYLGWLIKGLDLNGEILQNLRSAGTFENAHWRINLKPFSAQRETVEEKPLSIEDILPGIEDKSENYDAVAQILSYGYPHRQASLIPSKLSVSALKDADTLSVGENVVPLREAPVFMQKTAAFTRAQIGTFVHKVLMNLDIKRIGRENIPAGIAAQMNEMVTSGIMDGREIAAVHPDMIAQFLESGVGNMLMDAEVLRKETPFIIKMCAGEINAEWGKTDETILVQGIIDCWFETENRLILIDYKTDYAPDALKLHHLTAKYTHQIKLYDRALKEITGKAADEKYICFLTMKENILIP